MNTPYTPEGMANKNPCWKCGGHAEGLVWNGESMIVCNVCNGEGFSIVDFVGDALLRHLGIWDREGVEEFKDEIYKQFKQTAALREELNVQTNFAKSEKALREQSERLYNAEHTELEAVKKERAEWKDGAGLLQVKRSEALKERDEAFDLLKKVQILKSLMGYGEPVAIEHEEEAHSVNSLLSEIDYFLSPLEDKQNATPKSDNGE